MSPLAPLDARRGPHGSGGGECRCACGSLLARLVAEGVELKCRRCKRTFLVSLPQTRRPSAPAPDPAVELPVREAG